MKIGDVVYLRSGGPAMTVCDVASAVEKASCVWFSGGDVTGYTFSFAALTTTKPDDRPAPTKIPGLGVSR